MRAPVIQESKPHVIQENKPHVDEPKEGPTLPVIPTWWYPIKDFFRPFDRQKMAEKGRFDLGNYQQVKANAIAIYGAVADGYMPLRVGDEPDPRWSPEKVNTFRQWIENHCPEGKQEDRPGPERHRKSLTELCDWEIADLKKAFEGIMARNHNLTDSYFYIASLHGQPYPTECFHHFFGFLPWHRYYSLLFENALRSVPECGHVTLPYWDISNLEEGKALPTWIWEPPFAAYKYPIAVGDKAEGTWTKRQPHHIVTSRAALQHTHDLVESALKNQWWEGFADYQDNDDPSPEPHTHVEEAHDYTHVVSGGPDLDVDGSPDPGAEKQDLGDMTDVDYTAYDPLFWFQHSEFDRLCWLWQEKRNAKTAETHKLTHHKKDHSFLYLESDLAPWFDHQFIHLLNLDEVTFHGEKFKVSYSNGSFSLGVDPIPASPAPLPSAAHLASTTFKAAIQKQVVRLQFDRSGIEGSFTILLFGHPVQGGADRKKVGFKSVFQALKPAFCVGCSERSVLTYAFVVVGLYPEYSFEVHGHKGPVAMSACGTPKISIHNIVG